MDNGHYDFIIIGSGAGERGPFARREKENWNSLEVNARGRYNTKELWRTKDGQELHPHTNYYVGGNTKFYGAALFRLREQDFGEIKHYGGISPAWPISYDELEPASRRSFNGAHGHSVIRRENDHSNRLTDERH